GCVLSYEWLHGLGGFPQRVEHLVVGDDEVEFGAWAIELRDLRERQVLGEAARRQLLALAGEDREERPARGMRPFGAAIEIRLDAGAAERVLEQADVPLRRAQQDRDLVEADTVADFGEDPARDLDAFAPFAGSREEARLAAGRAFFELRGGEHPQ